MDVLPAKSAWSNLLRLIRPHQWTKNGFVFIGVVFSGQWHVAGLGAALLAFAAFCAMASAVYVLNDLFDIEADRRHPKKRHRPLASGAIGLHSAGWLLAGLATLAILLAWFAGPWVLVFVLAYLLMNIGYSWRWKHLVIIDVFIISLGFMLRILAGTVGLGIEPSSWLLLCGFMLTLFLGFGKRCAELLAIQNASRSGDAPTRIVLDHYNDRLVDQFMTLTAACTVLAYSLYTVDQHTVQTHGTAALLYTVPFVAYGVLRYLYLLHFKECGNDTARDLYTDSHLLLTVLAWIAASGAILYFRP